jgi:archaellum component FlaC
LKACFRWRRYYLAFDAVSFTIGLVAGALVGVLAGYLHETETIGELQERVRMVTVQLEKTTSTIRNRTSEGPAASDLRRQLEDLQEEIKRLYRRPDR